MKSKMKLGKDFTRVLSVNNERNIFFCFKKNVDAGNILKY